MPNGILEEQEQQRVMLLSRSPSGPKKYFPIPVENLEEEIRIRSADEGKLFREEFNSLTSGYVQGTFEMANKEENREKNRYPNILPYDHSRVILTQIDGVPPSDYINASYIDGYKEKNKFIAAQGPKQETVNDFWRMIWEQKSAVIVMLTNLKERKEEKCFQTDMQYSFIYQALLEYYLYGDTELDVSSLEKHLQTSQNAAPNLVKIGLEEEFKKLTNVRIMKENMRTGNLPANMKKARVIQIIPYDFNRVILSMKRGQEYTDYINASFIDGYRQKDYFIATQGPLPHTVEDFWRMVWEWKCHTIVMLTEVQEREQEKCCQYWPSEGSVTHGEITVEIKSDSLMDAISVRDFLVTYNPSNQEKQSRLVRQFHFHGWPEIGIPAEGKGMIDLIAAVQKQQQQTGNHPITVHCSAGAGRTGTFIALSNILERVKAEGLLDVFQAVKSLRLQRPHMVQTLEQYEFCYRVVQDFIDIFSDYANFK
ncbi:receptor-type tyrosine-protein phosphatase epsilon isoform X2 [Geospiza fortis]|uniref:protein-tyrosine-phosphatase n=1 Tax=Geospiza fortis TaxID=48883 RepID=A0A8N5I0N2_GEOFO|nr:receptor-type tyrosine-protein phosphatase epsilon isoform X2 [Geospiza fortis]